MDYIGIVTFGNPQYTRLCLQGIKDTLLLPEAYKIVAVVGKPDDKETVALLEEFEAGGLVIDWIEHDTNRGFPASINDIYDFVYGEEPEANILFMGNDTVPFPDAIESIFDVAEIFPEYDYLSGIEAPTKALLHRYPQFWDLFDSGYRFVGEDANSLIEHHYQYVEQGVDLRNLNFINGFHNFGMVRRSFFDKVGYVDAGFFPAYFEDNDYVKRGFNAGCKFGEVIGSYYLHFWSRTVYEAQPSKVNARHFLLNRKYYQDKWGGDPGQHETSNEPFSGADYVLGGTGVMIKNEYYERCEDRQTEPYLANYWKWTPRSFHNRHKGQRAIIAANGPSLNDINMGLINKEIVFALNRGYLKEGLPITYLVCVNGTVLEQFGEEIVNVDAEATFITPGNDLWSPHVYGLRYTPVVSFQENADGPIYQGHTVTYCALQLAYYMGFRDIALIGLDHYFPRAEGQETNKLVESETEDTDHFDPNYFGPGTKWEYPNLARSEEAFGLAREAFTKAGGSIFNCSAETKLTEEILPRMNLIKWLDY